LPALGAASATAAKISNAETAATAAAQPILGMSLV
jgi:hypothetical protein